MELLAHLVLAQLNFKSHYLREIVLIIYLKEREREKKIDNSIDLMQFFFLHFIFLLQSNYIKIENFPYKLTILCFYSPLGIISP